MSSATAERRDTVPLTAFQTNIDQHIRAGYQLLMVNTPEESRVEAEIITVANAQKMHVVRWTLSEAFSLPAGLSKEAANKHPAKTLVGDAQYKHPVKALEAVEKFTGNALFLFCDLDDLYTNPEIGRKLRSLCEGGLLSNQDVCHPIVILSPVLNVPKKLRSHITTIEFELPDESRLQQTFEYIRIGMPADARNCEDGLRDKIVSNLLGMTGSEAENCLARCAIQHGRICEDMIETVKETKAAIIRKSEILSYMPEAKLTHPNQLIGCENLFEFIGDRIPAYGRRARELQIDFPKGVVLLGPPGTGKSRMIDAIAVMLGMPRLSLDVSAIFGKYVGESEARWREAQSVISAMRGCVLGLDEFDKAMSGVSKSEDGGNTVATRVFGQILTWQAERRDPTFVVATMNRATVPPEFFRAGRFDAVFYTDLPQEKERRQICETHFERRGVAPATLPFSDEEWDLLVEKTKDFSGAEIEEMVRTSRYKALKRNTGTPTFDEVFTACSSINPLNVLDHKGIEEIRTVCKERGARPVGRTAATLSAPAKTRGVRTNKS